jgi:hypothetical protein
MKPKQAKKRSLLVVNEPFSPVSLATLRRNAAKPVPPAFQRLQKVLAGAKGW